jgi:hypothetical protein
MKIGQMHAEESKCWKTDVAALVILVSGHVSIKN